MITYPVDVEATRWAAVRISTGEVFKRREKWPNRKGQEIAGLDSDIALLLEVEAQQPDYDPDTQRLQRTEPVIDISGNTITTGWEVVDIPQDEQDNAAELKQVRAVYKDLKNGTGTQAQRLVRVERVLARLIKDNYGADE